ncbi:MAG: N-acetylmuramoyl-L-alanine amidase [Bergeyella zoohelcum]|nr:N-acetylmuramoyl-L-alanine amidase [Bergeyella zoohelcum]
MRKSLFITSLGAFIISCGVQKNIPQKSTPQKIEPKKEEISTPKVVEKTPIQHIGEYDFFKTNISNPTKNDNTISYGSIVSAKPAHYTINKNYFPAVGQNFRQRYLILHYTALDNEKSLKVLTEQSVSSHYLVNDLNDNEIHQLVDENKRAYHAGASYWRNIENLNDTSIGIEIVNKGYTTDNLGVRTFYDFPEWQFRKVAALVKDIVGRYQIAPVNVLAHSDIAPTRKQDPGPKFPWKRLYTEYGVGMWYDDSTKEKYLSQIDTEQFLAQQNSPTFIYQYQNLLNKFGYKLATTGSLDDATKKTIEAFQYHFRAENYNGIMDMETWAILQALVEKYPTK